jgi:hypothetical protein
MSNGREEKRSRRRHRVDIPVVCSRLTGDPHGVAYPGCIKTCSLDGLCVELSREIAVGTVLVVRAIRRAGDLEIPSEIPCMGIAAVRWALQRSSLPEVRYRIGLKYLLL